MRSNGALVRPASEQKILREREGCISRPDAKSVPSKNKESAPGTPALLSLSTRLVHAGDDLSAVAGAVAPVIVRSKTYRWASLDANPDYKYSRGANPTRAALERTLEGLENVPCRATVFASGLAAETCLFLTLSPGDHLILGAEVYGGTYRLIDQVLGKFGLSASYVDLNDAAAVRAAVQPRTRYIFAEPISNPSLRVVDLVALGTLARSLEVPLIVDATFAPPVAFDSFACGAETVVYSLSKYHAGHNDLVMGAVVTRNVALDEKLRFLYGAVGAIPSPDDCYRVIQGIKTLDLRFRRASESALAVAGRLAGNPKIGRTLYPGLAIHPGHEIARRQFTGGCGSVVSFALADESSASVRRFVDRIVADGLIVFGESLASPETILAYPTKMSHRSLPESVRVGELRITDGFFRLSLGFEDPEDILRSIERALS